MKNKYKIVRNYLEAITTFPWILELSLSWVGKQYPFLNISPSACFWQIQEYCASLLELCYSRCISKGKNGRLWIRFGQGCLGKQRKVDHNIILNLPPSFPLLKNHFTLIHQLPPAVWFLLFLYFKNQEYQNGRMQCLKNSKFHSIFQNCSSAVVASILSICCLIYTKIKNEYNIQ